MSGVAIVRALLAQTAAVTAVVPATNIRAGVVPIGTPLPAIGVHTISENEEETTARRYPQRLVRERVQVTVYTADDYPGLKRILRAARMGSGVHTGVIAGFQVRSVVPWGAGPDIPPDNNKIYEQSRDFMVTFVEAN